MYDHYKEAAWPDHYRRAALMPIATTLALQRSLRLVGLSGMGKSNLLRFLVSHPHLLVDWPDFSGQAVCFLYIDCNRLTPLSPLTFYRECSFLLQPEQGPPPSGDAYTLHKRLELALQAVDPQTVVILVIDQAERLYEMVDAAFFDQLRNLRDEARGGHMLFILGSRRPVRNLYELEKLFVTTCWVGPLDETDQTHFMAYHQQRLQFTVEPAWQSRLWQLSGGHPGLLKNSLEWLKWPERAGMSPDEAELTAALLAYDPIERYCRRLWHDLTPTEQSRLRALDGLSATDPALDVLKQSGLLVQDNDRLRLFSPLWAAYLQQQVWPLETMPPLRIELEAASWRVTLRWAGQQAETRITRPLVFELLRTLAAQPDAILSKDDLITTLYGDSAADVFDDALFQLIAALRKAIDPLIKQLCPAMTESVIQSVRGVGYRLVVDLPH